MFTLVCNLYKLLQGIYRSIIICSYEQHIDNHTSVKSKQIDKHLMPMPQMHTVVYEFSCFPSLSLSLSHSLAYCCIKHLTVDTHSYTHTDALSESVIGRACLQPRWNLELLWPKTQQRIQHIDWLMNGCMNGQIWWHIELSIYLYRHRYTQIHCTHYMYYTS